MAKKQKFTNLPDNGQVWKVGNVYYYAVKSPKGGGWMTWRFRDKQALKSSFPGGKIKINKKMSRNVYNGKGAVNWGKTDEIKNTSDHPFSQFLTNYKREARVNPMLKNKEVIAVHAQAILEGRAPSRAEIETTKYWRSRNAEERAWIQLAAADPESARQVQRRNRLETRDALVAAGFTGVPTVANQLADRFTKGNWSKQQLEREIEQMTDPFAGGASKFAQRSLPQGTEIVYNKKKKQYYARHEGVDYKMGKEAAKFYGSPYARKVTKVAGGGGGDVWKILSGQFDKLSSLGNVDEVRDQVETWLGPKFAKGWHNASIEKWAHKIRGNESERDVLEDTLRKQRMAILPEYDENLTYDDIAAPWRAMVTDSWGERMDEDDPLFYQILKMNDAETAAKLLRKEGVKRGNAKAQADAARALTESFGGQVTGTMGS